MRSIGGATFWRVLWQKIGRTPLRVRPILLETALLCLELEASRKLDLALTVERAAGCVDRSEVGGQRQRWILIGSTGCVDRRVQPGNLGSIEHVEAFNQEFQGRRFRELEATRNAHVKIHDLGEPESVAGYQIESGRATGTILSTTLRNTLGPATEAPLIVVQPAAVAQAVGKLPEIVGVNGTPEYIVTIGDKFQSLSMCAAVPVTLK